MGGEQSQCGINGIYLLLPLFRNRGDEHAWKLLHDNLRMLETLGGDALGEARLMWQDRASWWPRFHTVLLSEEATQHRREIIQALSSSS